MRDLSHLGDLRDSGSDGDILALQLPRPTLPVPLLVGGADSTKHRLGQAELFCQRSSQLRMVGDHAVEFAMTRDGELDPDPKPLDQRMPRTQGFEARRRTTHAPEGMVVLGRFQGEVVPEPLRLLVGIGVAANVDEESGVIDRGALLLAQPHPFSKS
jgi:hypothetical protein